MAGFNNIEASLIMTLDSLSNREGIEIKDEWIDEAGEALKDALRRQLQPQPRSTGLRMSNLGRPLCQLQNELGDAPRGRDPYNHILRMMIGDATEIMVNLVLKASGLNVTNSKSKHSIDVDGTVIKGEDDTEIDGKIFDIKSASPYAFNHKWSEGWSGVYYGDSFGYVSQLWSYSDKDSDKMGGWIVVDKSSGELKVVLAEPTIDQLNEISTNASNTVHAIVTNQPFKKCFEPEIETYYKKPTGNTLVPMVCTFCPFMRKCWPTARMLPKIGNKNNVPKSPRQVWYVDFKDDNS